MSVHIREFILHLGVEGDSAPTAADNGADDVLTRADLEALRREIMEYCQQLVSDSNTQPFER